MTKKITRFLTVILAMLLMFVGTSVAVVAEESQSTDILQKMLVVYNMDEKVKDGVSYFPIHVYAAIDSLKYEEVGMTMTVSSISGAKAPATKTFSTTNVYSAMKVTNSKGEVTRYTPDQLGGAYLFGHEMLFTTSNWIGTDVKITVTPYAINKAGETIKGKTIEITDEAIKQRDPSSGLFKQPQTFITAVEVPYVVESGIQIALGELFAAAEGADIDSSKVSVTVSDGVEYVPNTSDWTQSTLEFNSIGSAFVTIKEGTNLPTTLELDVTQLDKFDNKFQNTDKYIYRVGNENAVSLESLFVASGIGTIDSAKVTVDIIGIEGSASGTYTANTSDWTKATIRFADTGTVKVIVNEGENIPTELFLEVVDGYNTTAAASATSKNIVLLNDCNFSTISVTNGYTLYGNGFTLTSPSDVTGDNLSTAFVTLDNGTLDNVRVICPNFSLAIMYNGQTKVDGNVDPNAEWRYFNVRSAVTANNNSKILNSYISGGRNAVYFRNGNLTVDNSTIHGGAVSNICVSAAQKLTLRDVNFVQRPLQATVNDTSKTLMGLGILVLCDGNGGASTPVVIEGDFVQYVWANTDYSEYVPTGGDTIIKIVQTKGSYKHTMSLEGGDVKDWYNLGIAYMPDDNTSSASVAPPNIIDNRSNKATVPYSLESMTVAGTTFYAYSYENSNGTDDSFKTIPQYESEKHNAIVPEFIYNDSAVETTKDYDSINGWQYTITADLDALGSFTLDFESLVAEKCGVTFDYTVTDADGNAVDKSQTIVLNDSGVYEYVISVNDNLIYGTNGMPSGETVVHEIHLIVVATKTSIAPPEKVAEVGGSALVVVKAKDGDWSCALPALMGTKIKYYSVAEKTYKTLTLADITPTSTGKQNETNNYWEYSSSNNDYKLKITCGVIHEGKGVYGMPVVVDNNGTKEMYFTISSTTGYVSSGTSARAVTLSYEFSDNNGGTLNFSKTWNVVRADYINAGGKQYSYSDFVNGTLKEAGGESCLVEGTMITLADGSKKAVEDIKVGDMVMIFNHVSGEYEAMPIVFNTHIDQTESSEYDVLTLQFANGEEIGLVEAHGFFDTTLMQYVYIDYDNYADFIGHEFYNINGERIELVDAFIESRITRIFCPVSYFHMNSFANGFLNTPNIPGDITGLVNYFEYDSNLKYNEEAMARDIDTYGLYTYDDFSEYISEAAYNSSPSVYLKVAVGKGMITYEQIIDVINYLLEGALID